MPSEFFQPPTVSIVVTTHRSDSYYTQACLESIRRWKNAHHQLIVISHDESALLRAYLEACRDDGLIDRLLYAVPNHGHTRSFNLGVRHARGNEIFNVGNDILIGPSLIDDCAYKLRNNPQLGLIGWHWYNEGTFWEGEKIREFALHDDRNPLLSAEDQEKLRSTPWYTGRLFHALGRPLQLRLCNTSFFGIRRRTLESIGGGFGPQYPHYFADDALCYGVLDLGLDVRHFERKFRNPAWFREFQYENIDVPDRRRHDDFVRSTGAYLDSIRLLGGGMTEAESIFLHLLARAIPNGATVTSVGVWLGSSAIVLLDALRDKRIRFEFIDCFDLPGISGMSGQPPVCQEEFVKNIEPYIGPGHSIAITRANTLEVRRFPQSDFLFLDGGHTAQCVAHDARLIADCLNPAGTAAFHDYGSPHWPDVKPEVDRVFGLLECHGTVAVYRRQETFRLSYEWP
jgi:GT2 family glycosyltransferase